MPQGDPRALGGWLGIDEKQQHFAAQFERLRSAAPQLMHAYRADPTTPMLLYKAWLDVLKVYPPYPAQQIGDCVSFGHGHALDLLQCIELALGEQEAYSETLTEFIYATSREVAGILGNSDGSYGSAAVKAMQQMGSLNRAAMGDAGSYTGKRSKEWGRTGAPADVKEKAKAFKLGNAALVNSWDELVAAITNGYPVTICSDQGFTMTRDREGFCSAEGSWGHCMFIAGVRFDRPGACICQSWGPDVPGGPLGLDQPGFSFWAERKVIERIIGQGDSWALSGAPDFVPRPMPKSWNWSLAA